MNRARAVGCKVSNKFLSGGFLLLGALAATGSAAFLRAAFGCFRCCAFGAD